MSRYYIVTRGSGVWSVSDAFETHEAALGESAIRAVAAAVADRPYEAYVAEAENQAEAAHRVRKALLDRGMREGIEAMN